MGFNMSDIKSRASKKKETVQEVIQPNEVLQGAPQGYQQAVSQEPVYAQQSQQPNYGGGYQQTQQQQSYQPPVQAQQHVYEPQQHVYEQPINRQPAHDIYGGQPAQYQPQHQQPVNRPQGQDMYGSPISNVPATISPVHISTEMIARRLGLDPTQKIDILKPTPLGVDAIVIREVRDVKGKIREKVRNLSNMYRIPTVPFELGIMSNVIQIQEYEIVTVMGKQYASCNSRSEDYSLIQDYISRIKQHLEDGEDFCEDLLIDVNIGEGTPIKTLGLNQHELQLVCGYFRNYNPMLVTVGSSFKLCIGM